jgi:Flp pilus assembly pilin Flp
MPVMTRKNVTPPSDADPANSRKTRRGVTAMEYLMMISLIVVVCLIAIGYLGGSNNGNMSYSATSINSSLKKGS